MEKFILIWILFLNFAMLHCLERKKKCDRTALGCHLDATAFFLMLAKNIRNYSIVLKANRYSNT